MIRFHSVLRFFNPMALGLLLFMASFLQAEYLDDWGPAIGTSLPDLKVQNTKGQDKVLDNLSGENGLLLFVVRSTNWDGACKRQLVEVNERLDEIASMSVGAAAISYDQVKDNQKFRDTRALGFPLLSDVGYESVKALGVFDESIPETHFAYGISRPGVLFVDSDGIVILKWAVADPNERPALEDMLSAVRDHLGIEKPPVEESKPADEDAPSADETSTQEQGDEEATE